MAPKRSAPPPPPPPAASDEETASGSGSEESEEEEEEIAYSPPPAAPKTMAPPPQKGQESEEEEEEEEDEEEEEEDEEEEEGNTIQVPPPLATKNPPPPPPNREESESSGEDEEEDTDEDDEKPQPQPAPNKVAEGKGAKSSLTEDKKAAVPFQRTWSPEDEVRILEAMAAHRRKHGTLPHVEALAATLDGTLDNTDRSVASLQVKLRNMKRRYTLAAKKGEPPSKDHDRRLFDLSKTVWGSTAAAANGAPAANGGAWREDAEMCKLYPFLAEEVMELRKSYKGLFKREFGMINDDKARALDEKIRKQRLHQAKLNMNRFDLMKEVTKTLLDLSNTSSRP